MNGDVKVGQKWRDLDKRCGGRIREIVAVGSDQSGIVRWVWYSNCVDDTRTDKYRIRIRADRLRKPFFELVK